MDQLREHMRNHMTRFGARESGDNVFRLSNARSRAGEDQSSKALELVYQAAEVIKANEDRAAEAEACALDAARHAIEELENAVRLISSAEEAKRTSEARAHVAESAIMELDSKVQALEKILRDTQTQISSLQAQLSDTESRAETAEKRATEATRALACVENAIRTKLLGERRNVSRSVTVAA